VAPVAGRSGDDGRVTEFVLPRVPASAGALIRNPAGHVLILQPTYKSGWTVPGGQMEEDGETPWESCRREVREETGLTVESGRLACVDFLRPRSRRPGGLRFLFDCGVLDPGAEDHIALQVEEIRAWRWATPDQADQRLSGPVGRRVAQALAHPDATVYLEDGRPVGGVAPR
jgi:8-oxo-dGTP pyrophosphatase MutT (NUDIX family)